uniref:Pre-mRNA-processing factor 39-like n=1 Tax=Saccoglossus kowalevskii TaxID=10224 RepID=A0ABM0MXT7_SACKO|nr:PREDICTED: pre-mRNA-processing factor 39-like [Saccoglossus kowalevskii]
MADTETVEMPETEKVNPVSGVQADTEQENNAVVEEPNEEVTKEISNVNQDEYEPMDNTQLKAEEMEAQAEITEAQIEEPMVQSEEPVAQSEELVAQSEEPMVQSEETKEPEKEDQVVPEEKVTEEPSPPPELEKYWKVVRDNCSDFTGWTYLLQYVEQENHLESAREAFSAFFDRYPYCYGYWKKLADLEKKHGNLDRACEAFDRGTRAIALSVDLWIHYINFFMDNFANDSDFVERTRSLFDRAVAASGTEFRSDKLWDMYINWEKEKKNLKKMTGLYDKLLGIPTQLYSHHFDQFKEHVNGNMPRDILTTDEFLKMRTEVIASNPIVESDVVDDAPPGVEAPPGMEDPETNASKLDAETVAIRTKIIETRKEVFRVTEEEVSRRWAFEEGIKRPYFHVKPLERAQLKNWREYLDFEIENGSHERVVVLFERCMIACALYEDFWLKYARYMEPHSKEGVSAVFRRACHIHLPKKPNIHLQWAAYEEQQGNIEEAREVFKNLEAVVPGLAMVTLRRINLERRHGDLDTVDKVFKDCLSRSKSKKLASFYAIKYSRFHSKIQNDTEKAKAVLNEALKKDQV